MNREMRRLQEREERRQKKEGQASKAQRKASALASRQAPSEKKSFVRRIGDYLHEVRMELRKVTWPNREQMIAFSTVTILTSIILTFVIFGLDFVMKEGVFWLLDRA